MTDQEYEKELAELLDAAPSDEKSIQKEEYAEYIRRWAPGAGDGS